MKRFNALCVGLMSFLMVFGLRGMDFPKNQLLDLFNNANNAIKFCIMKKNDLVPDTIEEFNLTRAITTQITQSYQTLATHGLGQADLNQINNIAYSLNNVSFFEKLKTASLKACIATQPHLLCSLLENTFARFDCNNQIYQPMQMLPKAINEVAQKSKPDTLFLIEQLIAKVSKSRTPSKVYLQKYSKYLEDMYLFCSKSNQDLLKTIKKNILAICNSNLPAEVRSSVLDPSFGQSSLNQLDMSELLESKIHEPSEDELLASLSATAKKIIEELGKLSEPFKVENFDTIKNNIASSIDVMYAQIKQIEKDIPANSGRLINLQIIKRNILRLTKEKKLFDTKKPILLIQKIKNKTIANIKKKNSPLALESSSLGLQKTVVNLKIERAKENRKDIVEKLHKQNAELITLANSKKINESYITLLKEHIETLQEYSSHLIGAEANRKKKTEIAIKKHQERLEKAISKVYHLLPYPSLENPLLISIIFSRINRAIATNNINDFTQAIQDFRDAYRPRELISINISSRQIADDFFSTPDDLKKLINSRLQYDSKKNCELIPFFLHEIYKHQLAKDNLSQQLALSAQKDLFSIIGELQIKHQWLFSRSKIINIIISDGLDQQKMQACLMLLNKMCSFYQEIKNDSTEDAIDQIALKAYGLLQKNPAATELRALIATTVNDLNDLVQIKPTNIESPEPKTPFIESQEDFKEGFDSETPQIPVIHISPREEIEASSEADPKIPQIPMLLNPEPATLPSKGLEQPTNPTKALSILDEPEDDTEDLEKLNWDALAKKLTKITAVIPNQPVDQLKKTINDLQSYLPTTFTDASRIAAQEQSDIYNNVIQTLYNCIQELAEKEKLALKKQTNIDINYFKNISDQIQLFESLLRIEQNQKNLTLIKNIIDLYRDMIDAGIQKIREIKDPSERRDTLTSHLGNDAVLKPYLLNEERYESITTTLIDDYRKTAHELIAKDYSSSSLEEIRKNLNELYEIKNSGLVNELSSQLEPVIMNLSQELLNRTNDFLKKTTLNTDSLIPSDHFQKLGRTITSVEQHIYSTTDNEIVQLYWDKLSHDINLLIGQIKNKKGIFTHINEQNKVEKMVRQYLDDKSEILEPFLARVLSEIKDNTLPLPREIKPEPAPAPVATPITTPVKTPEQATVTPPIVAIPQPAPKPEQPQQPTTVIPKEGPLTPPQTEEDPLVSINPTPPVEEPQSSWRIVRAISSAWRGIKSFLNSLVSYFTYAN